MIDFRIYPKAMEENIMKQYEAVIVVMEERGGFATLGDLYNDVFKVENVKWGTKTPFASIRRIVQDEKYFFKIKPGLWALKTYRNEILKRFELSNPTTKKVSEFNHTYFQGLLLEIGKLRKMDTYIPAQDKNKIFLQKPLSEMATINKFYNFTYEHILDKAKSIDVAWFNERKLPHSFFEVEHSTDFKNSLLKFIELQDFNVEFRVVADKHKEKQFQSIISMNAFRPIAYRVKFLSYDILAELHTKTIELNLIETNI